MKTLLLSSLYLAVAQSRPVGWDGTVIPGTVQAQHWNLLIVEHNMKEQHGMSVNLSKLKGGAAVGPRLYLSDRISSIPGWP